MTVTLPVAGGGTCVLSSPKIIALGLNYLDHIAETGQETPREPIIFSKTPNVLIGPGEPVILPAWLHGLGLDPVVVHYEAELAVVIGRRASRVPAERALDHVLGYTCFNDVSQRNLQFADRSGWFRGKSLDTFGPIGPRVVPLGLLPGHEDLGITCRLNGRVVQQSRTGRLLFKVPEVIEWITRQITLEAGDVIATGTPGGVGAISHDDLVEVEIEGIGVLSTPVIDERAASDPHRGGRQED
jgi:2-keto-4-pentenoate hydratase/2-oxohepta-3-ene-1,7-dioic acid hydratase in catechol pathway